MAIYEISPLVSSKTAVFPGDTVFESNFLLAFEKGNHLELSKFTTTPHIGAHADSSSHYHAKGEGIEKREIKKYFGKAQVIEVSVGRGERILLSHLGDFRIEAPRVLFKTGSFPNPEHWNSDFVALSPEVIKYLAQQGVTLVGIDTPSVDPESSKALESHQALFETNMAVLEGLDLSAVATGSYFLIALPLRLEGLDASPVRAILCDHLEELF